MGTYRFVRRPAHGLADGADELAMAKLLVVRVPCDKLCPCSAHLSHVTFPTEIVEQVEPCAHLPRTRVPTLVMDAPAPTKRKRSGKAREEAKARAIAAAEEEKDREEAQDGSDAEEDDSDEETSVPDLEVIRKRIVCPLSLR